jgi:hypothetical protein
MMKSETSQYRTSSIEEIEQDKAEIQDEQEAEEEEYETEIELDQAEIEGI